MSKEWKEYHAFMDNLTRSEMGIIGHLKPLTFDTPQDIVKEARRLLGESIAKCKVIPFPSPTKPDLDRRIAKVFGVACPSATA